MVKIKEFFTSFVLFIISIQFVIASDAAINYVFKKRVSSSKEIELIRLYDDNTYEHLKFKTKKWDNTTVEKNTGKYMISKNKLTLKTPLEKEFRAYVYNKEYFLSNSIYLSIWDKYFKRNSPFFTKTDLEKYKQPYFINPERNVIVNNKNISNKIDLNELVAYITGGLITDKDKAYSIARFIMKSIEYDYTGLRRRKYANAQNDTKAILAGRRRLAVCAGYAYAFDELANIAGLNTRQVAGNTRSSANDISRLGGYHAWNIVYFEDVPKIFDVTWADGNDEYWLEIDPRLMIFSHFPDNTEDQLLKDTVSLDKFKHMAVAIPHREFKYYPVSNSKGTVYSDSIFHIAFKGNPEVIIESTSNSIFNTIYSDEHQAGNKSHTFIRVQNLHSKTIGDSLHFHIPLKQLINPIRITIDNSYVINYKVIKGDFKHLMVSYSEKASNAYVDPFIKGIVSSIYLNNKDKLKMLVGDNSNVFFNDEGKLNLAANIVAEIKNWDGTLTAWTQTLHSNSTMDDEGNWLTESHTENSISINDDLKFVFIKENDKWVITDVKFD
jgi:transglutaminase/protease-like cytokinesis protein 3